jgi:ABC-type hemin transport system substrate-binding protein
MPAYHNVSKSPYFHSFVRIILHLSLHLQLALGNAGGASCAEGMRQAAAQLAPHSATSADCTGAAAQRSNGQTKKWTGSTKSKQVTWEQVAEADPDVIIVCGCGLDLQRNREDALPVCRQHPVASTLRAVKQGRLFAMDGNRTLSRPGPSLVEGAAAVAACAWYDDEARMRALQDTECLPAEDVIWGKLAL